MYSSPVKNMRAAEAAATELPNLAGEELVQQHRVQELLAAANKQQADLGQASQSSLRQGNSRQI